MALTATIFKAQVSIADIDRGYYADHNLTLARHPSETDERLMVRLLAFIANAHERLTFGKGLSDDDEPDLWHIDYDGTIVQWIELGQPDEKRLRRACGRARSVLVYSYSGSASDIWWKKNSSSLRRLTNLSVWFVPAAQSTELATWAERSMTLQVTVQDGQIWLTSGERSLTVELVRAE